MTDEEISQTTAELSNVIENNTLVVGGVPVPLKENPALIANFNTDQEQQSDTNHLFIFPIISRIWQNILTTSLFL